MTPETTAHTILAPDLKAALPGEFAGSDLLRDPARFVIELDEAERRELRSILTSLERDGGSLHIENHIHGVMRHVTDRSIDLMLEVWDMAVERRSRAHSGGLLSSEYVVHGLLTTLRATAITFTIMIDRNRMNTNLLDAFVRLLLPGSIIIALAHVALAFPAGRALLGRGRETVGR